jgi:hypothetical protein
MVLLSSDGYPVGEIAAITRRDDTFRHWIQRFLYQGWRGLLEAPRSGRPAVTTLAIEQFLHDCLQGAPRDFRIARPSWTTDLLAQVVRRRLKVEVTGECTRTRLTPGADQGRVPPAHLDGQAPGTSQAGLRSKKGWLTRLLQHPPRGAASRVYVQDYVELSLFPTLTRMWIVRGQQRKIRALGVRPPKRQECGATDRRTGEIVRVRTKERDAEAFCKLAEKCMARSASRKRRVIMVTDGAKFHTPEGSLRIRAMLAHYGRRLRLRYTPGYSPECMPMEP